MEGVKEMEGDSEPTIKPEKEDQVWTDSENKGEGTQVSVNLSENASCAKDFLQIKDKPQQISDCIKKEMKGEVEVGVEEWKEFETEERDCFPGCVEGDVTDASQVSLTHTGLTGVFQKAKVESHGDAECNDLALETVLGATEGKDIEPGEDWLQVRSSHKSSKRLKCERIFTKKFGCGRGHLLRPSPGKIIPLLQNLGNSGESEENLRKKFGCEREAVVKLARLRQDTAVPLQGTNSRRKLDHVTKETVMPDSNTKSFPLRLNMAEDPGGHFSNKGGSAELNESFSGRNIFDQLSANIFGKSYVDQHSPVNRKETQFSHIHHSYVARSKDVNIYISQNKERKFECPQCSYKTNYRSHFTQHCLTHSNIKRFACDQCSYKTNDKSNLTRHCINHSNVKKFSCDQCSYKTNCRTSFTRHCLNHTNIKKFACGRCSYKTNDKKCLTEHCLTHSSLRQFACDQCSYNTNNKSNFTKHCVSHTNIKKFACGQCSYKTNYRSSFTQHCLNHRNIKKFACDQCSYKTNNKAHLTQHCITHSSIRRFACDQCSYKTNNKSHLTQHCLSHTNINKFACGQCLYKTNCRSSFTQHCLIHSNIKKYTCGQCSYKTNYRSSFTQHCLNHSNIKKFACDQCSFKTNNKSHLTQHCINHSNIKKFVCDQCSYKTNCKGRFTQHCLIHENKEICNNTI